MMKISTKNIDQQNSPRISKSKGTVPVLSTTPLRHVGRVEVYCQTKFNVNHFTHDVMNTSLHNLTILISCITTCTCLVGLL
jgi:hypothetical protein